MAAHLSSAVFRGSEIAHFKRAVVTWFRNVLKKTQVWMWLWWLRILALYMISVDIINGITGGHPNVGHLGGIVAGFLIGLSELHLSGPPRALFIFMWILVALVWVRISSNLEQGGLIFSPAFDRNVSASFNASCVSECLSECT